MSHPRAYSVSTWRPASVYVWEFKRYLPISKLFQQRRKKYFSHKFYFYRQIFLLSAALFAFFHFDLHEALCFDNSFFFRFDFFISPARVDWKLLCGREYYIDWVFADESNEGSRAKSTAKLVMWRDKGMNVMTSLKVKSFIMIGGAERRKQDDDVIKYYRRRWFFLAGNETVQGWLRYYRSQLQRLWPRNRLTMRISDLSACAAHARKRASIKVSVKSERRTHISRISHHKEVAGRSGMRRPLADEVTKPSRTSLLHKKKKS